MIVVEASSPNFGERRNGLRPTLVVLHHTAMATAEAALARLRDPASEVSAHYLIAENGRVWRLVDEEKRAWHAGAGWWRGMDDINSRSIGIELANPGPLAGHPPFAEPLMAALEVLLDGIMARWAIAPGAIIAHSDMAPGRKADPGPKFDWRRLARGGRAVAPAGSATAGWAAFGEAAAAAGYPGGGDRAELLAATRLRLRPWARAAEPEAEDTGALLALAEAAWRA
jgi:N-acetylmuramoyl-L-alanine amidase